MSKRETDLRWQDWAKQLGFESEREMWLEMYRRHTSLTKMSKAMNVSLHTALSRMSYNGVERRKRGGANRQKFVMDRKMVERITAQGLKVVAKNLNVTPQALYSARRKFLKANPEFAAELRQLEERMKAAAQPASPPQPSSEPASSTDLGADPQECTPQCQTESSPDEFEHRRTRERLEEEEADV